MQKTLKKLAAGEKATIVALGDSNTELTWHTAGRLNWVGLLQEALMETFGHGLPVVINAGRCGDSALDACGRVERDVIPFCPDLLIICLGTNAMFHGSEGADSFADAMRSIVGKTREECGSEILLRTPNPVVASNQPGLPSHHRPGYEWPEYSLAPCARRIVELAAELDCSVVDHYSLWTQSEALQLAELPNHLWMRMSDATHPNALGHLCFYRELAPLFGLPHFFPWEA